MRLLWHFIGRAHEFADRVEGLQVADFQLDAAGHIVLPLKGDQLKLRVRGRENPEWFRCAGRTFDYSTSDEPELHISLELG